MTKHDQWEEKKIEEDNRINKITCPVCHLTNKKHVRVPYDNKNTTQENLVYDFFICQNCGTHYSDINKKKPLN